MASSDFEFIKPSNVEEIEFLAKTLYGCFLQGEETFCYVDYFKKIYLVLDENKQWIRRPFEEHESFPKTKELSMKEGIALTKEFPPWEVIAQIKKEKEEERKREFEENLDKCQSHVLGWINASNGTSCALNHGQLSEDEYLAIVKDIREHGYLFSGEDHQNAGEPCNPVLEDYTYVDFSVRGWGGVMADARGDFEEMAYTSYTGWHDLPGDKVFPPFASTYKEKKPQNEFKVTHDIIEGLLNIAQAKEEGERYAYLFFAPFPSQGHYWFGDQIKLSDEETTLIALIEGIYIFNNKEDFEEKIELLKAREEITLVYETLPQEEGPYFVLALSCDGVPLKEIQEDITSEELDQILFPQEIQDTVFIQNEDGLFACLKSEDSQTSVYAKFDNDQWIKSSPVQGDIIDRQKAKAIFDKNTPYACLSSLYYSQIASKINFLKKRLEKINNNLEKTAKTPQKKKK